MPPATGPQPRALYASDDQLKFGRGETVKTFSISNSEGVPLEFRVLSDVPWVSVEPSHGHVSGQPVTLTVTLNTEEAGTRQFANLRINSVAGHLGVRISKVAELKGQFSGNFEVLEPYALGGSTLSVQLEPGDAPGTVVGYLEPERSLLFPFRSAVKGSVEEDGAFVLNFVVPGPPGTDMNPYLSHAIERTIRLVGKVQPDGGLAGILTDTVSGLSSNDFVLSGAFSLQWVGDYVVGEPTLPPSIELETPVSPFDEAFWASCNLSCPGNGCGTNQSAGNYFLETSTAAYETFANATYNGENPHEAALVGACSNDSCVDEFRLRCAQQRYLTRMESVPLDDDAFTGFLDTMEVLADTSVLKGNQKLVSTMENWRNTTNILDDLPLLHSARAFFLEGSRGGGGLKPLGMLDAYTLDVLEEHATAVRLRSGGSFIPGLLGDEASRGDYEHLRRQVGAVSGAARAHVERAVREHRLGRISDARASSLRGAIQAYLDGAVLGALLLKAEAPPAELAELELLKEEMHALSLRFDDINDGRNPAGYLPSFVPMYFEVTGQDTNNFRQIYEQAVRIYNQEAKASQDAAQMAVRDFESRLDSLQTQINAQGDHHQNAMLALCGPPDETCGVSSGAIYEAFRELRMSHQRLQLVDQRMLNLGEAIRIEQQRAADQVELHDNQVYIIDRHGNEAKVLDRQARENAQVSTALSMLGGVLAAGENPGQALGAVINGASALMAIAKSEEIDEKRANLEVAKLARYEYKEKKAKLIDSAAKVRALALESSVLTIEVAIAKEAIAQTLSRLVGLMNSAELLEAQWARTQSKTARDAFKSIQYRIHTDALLLRAEADFRRMMEWSYLATRALEYELNVSYGPSILLWQKRRASDLNTYLGVLLEYYLQEKPATPPQVTTRVLSLRDDILGLGNAQEDAVTGHVYSPQERFRYFVSDPSNRDIHGNLKITFTTLRPDAPLFSQSVCNDRIQSIRMNLIGSNLGERLTRANVRLSQGGTNFLRDCETGALVDYSLLASQGRPRVGLVQAGVNAPADGSGLAPNTDHMYQAVLAGPWELVIDQRPEVEPLNAAFDLSQLDDIEIMITHEATTLQ